MQLTLFQAQQISKSKLFTVDTLPAKTGLMLARLLKSISSELALLDEAQQKLITSCNGVLSEDGQNFHFAGEDAIKFNAGMTSLLQDTMEAPGWPISFHEFGDLHLSPFELAAIEPLIAEEVI